MAKKSMIARETKRKYPIRVRNRCLKCGRSRGYIRRFRLCRICFRELALHGEHRHAGCVFLRGERQVLDRAGDGADRDAGFGPARGSHLVTERSDRVAENVEADADVADARRGKRGGGPARGIAGHNLAPR